ncbi:MAG TPA: cytochrome c, partial [Kofleriaceae bacterium]|nr:cytochrome c [Kofleriaceae bacterium]
TPLAAPALVAAPVAAVELGDALFLVAPDHIAIQRGAAVTRVPPPDGAWAEAIAMPALDDAATWVVARTAAGTLWRITTGGDLVPIHDLLGLAPPIRSIASTAAGAAAGATAAFAMDHAIGVLHDRAHLAQFPLPDGPGALAVSPTRLAIRRADQLEVWDLGARHRARFTVPGLVAAGFAGDTLVAASRDAVFVEADHQLHRRAAPAPITGLAIAGARAWLATTAGLFRVDADRLTRADAPAADRVLGLAGGDLVTATARLSPARPDDDPRWIADVAPIFRRVCARCHAPPGDALDLSTAAAWRAHRAALERRVVETRSMPPAGTPISDADRAALAAWLR